MFFNHNYAEPGPGINPDAPEKTGFRRFFEILQLECVTIFKLNLLFLAGSLLVVTIPPALYAMNMVIRKMILDEPVLCFYDYRKAFREGWKRSYAAFFLTAGPLALSGYGASFYLGRAAGNPLMFVPFVFCSTIFLAAMLASSYFYGILSTGRGIGESLRLSLLLGLGRPARALLGALCFYGMLLAALLAFPASAAYLLLIGFSLPNLLGNFFIRTTLRQYCPPLEEEEEP